MKSLSSTLLIFLSVVLLVQSNECFKPNSNGTESADEPSRLNMTIYIESLCKFSRKFIQEQLQPIYDDIKDKLNIKFFTFALSETKVTDDDEIKIKCMHGPKECEIDMFQTCALRAHRNNQTLQAEIIFCTMGTEHPYTNCIDKLQLNNTAIEKCKTGALGLYLAFLSQQESANVVYKLNGVPAVIFNNIVDLSVEENALTNLKDVIKRRIFLYYKKFDDEKMNKT